MRQIKDKILMHPPEDALIAYLDFKIEDIMQGHLTTCFYCTVCTEPYLGLQSDIFRALYRQHCPSNQTLCDFHLGLLSLAEALSVKQHLIQCPHCSLELEELAQFLAET